MQTTTAMNTHTLRPFTLSLGIGLLLAMPLAQAHHPMGGATPGTFTEGMLSGLAHPVIGLDHLAFLLVAALLTATVQGRARHLLPLAFVGATLAGTLYHLGTADLAISETVVALSALLGGVAVLLGRSLPALLMGALFGLAGVFHGYAYGEAIIGAEQGALLAYLVGFALIQYLLIAGGATVTAGIAQRSQRLQGIVMRAGGVFAATIGLLFLGLNLAG